MPQCAHLADDIRASGYRCFNEKPHAKDCKRNNIMCTALSRTCVSACVITHVACPSFLCCAKDTTCSATCSHVSCRPRTSRASLKGFKQRSCVEPLGNYKLCN